MRDKKGRGRPPRLSFLFQQYDLPFYFVTLCTMDRAKILANDPVHNAFSEYAEKGMSLFNIAVGRYVIMPDHLHLFIKGGHGFKLAQWIKGLKRHIGRSLSSGSVPKQIWQRGFFDHLLRTDESYGEKWNYIRNNPVRAGLVDNADDWKYQGEANIINRL